LNANTIQAMRRRLRRESAGGPNLVRRGPAARPMPHQPPG
jgi:hypothetical protein